jgi:hypothetical protein
VNRVKYDISRLLWDLVLSKVAYEALSIEWFNDWPVPEARPMPIWLELKGHTDGE